MTQALHLTPPAAPLPMPTQVLSRQPGRRFASQDSSPLMARLLVFGGSLALLMVASYQMYLTLPLNEATLAAGVVSPWMMGSLWLLLALFSITFGWVALTAMAALAGFLYGQDRYRAAPDAALQSKTVLLMPVYNEDPVSAAGALAAMAEELGDLGVAEHFEIFVLSDTVNPDILSSEAAAVACLRERLAGIMPVWYRRRQQNTARKAGNIRDFVSRWGERYDYMVVLDADSLMAGSTLATLVREMDADPRAGILQTLPRLYGGETLYARLQQFAGVIYGPVFARGLNAWQGLDGNYWGHNAILRVRAMAESAGLPRMPGPGPFGGEILSHDFVEAALIRRAGWTVRMLPGLPGSWEECPPTLLDAAVRDRRWAQGNVQHLAVIRAQGLRWPNRAHMLMGIMNYVTSPIWLALVVVGLLLSTQLYQPSELLFDAESMLGVFLVTMLLL
ncbi:MAG: glucans biosynthesis glucosyltransferase MdoH, partial [Pseudohongiellaceae bacterium]